jgi:hypothetical protein
MISREVTINNKSSVCAAVQPVTAGNGRAADAFAT